MAKDKNIADIVKHLPSTVTVHIRKMAEQVTKLESDDAFARLVGAWVVKRAMFDRIVEHGNFKKVEKYDKNSTVGCIALTISGSIVTVGPLEESVRRVTYASIGLRVDVPEVKTGNKGVLEHDIILNRTISFVQGPIKSTSVILDIAIIEIEKNSEEQKKEINVANELLYKKFVDVNRDVMADNYKDYELKGRDDLFEQWIILQWFSIGGLDEYIFLARARILWLELFTELYEYLSVTEKLKDERDSIFIRFSNENFGHYIDEYKWLESEKKDFDIGLMKALEEIPGHSKYWDFVDAFIKKL